MNSRIFRLKLIIIIIVLIMYLLSLSHMAIHEQRLLVFLECWEFMEKEGKSCHKIHALERKN